MVAYKMEDIVNQHQPVLLAEVMTHLAVNPDGVYVDATFGRGGHAREILQQLSPKGRLFAIDKDPEAVAYAKQHFGHDPRFTIQQGSFAHLETFLKKQSVAGLVDGILMDLGVSSPQLDTPSRGFSFLREGDLDMRMDLTQEMNAANWVATVSETDIANVLWHYGEERFSRRIARAVVKAREEAPITTTVQLAEIVAAAIPRWEKGKHPATRSFQAIRIAVNHELDDLEQGLKQSLAVLKIRGRLLVISFHSLEDRIVKHFIREQEEGERLPARLPIKQEAIQPKMRHLGKAIKASEKETARNPRARSAVLRIAEKLS